MLTDSCLNKEVKRLFKLPFAPTTDEDQKGLVGEYKRVLRSRAETDAHLTAIIDRIMDSEIRCPPAAQVAITAGEIAPPQASAKLMGCEECGFWVGPNGEAHQGNGYMTHVKKVSPGGVEPYDADYSTPCACALGRVIQAGMDKRREAARAKRAQ